MKRYNIHLDPEWIKALDEVRQSIIAEKDIKWRIQDLTRSDLIRMAIGHYFNLGRGHIHYYGVDLDKIVKRVIKKRGPKKGV